MAASRRALFLGVDLLLHRGPHYARGVECARRGDQTFVLGHEIGCRTPARLFLIVHTAGTYQAIPAIACARTAGPPLRL